MMPSPDPAPAAPEGAWLCSTCGVANPVVTYPTACVGCGDPRDEPSINTKGVDGDASTSSATVEVRPRLRDSLASVILGATWLYAAAILVTLALIHWVGEAWWGVTVLLFVPRWAYLAPVVLLAVCSGILGRRSHWLKQGTVALVVAGPLMGFSLPVHRLWTKPPEGFRVRVLTYNRGALSLDGASFVEMLERERIDLICFQEGFTDTPEVENFMNKGGWHRDSTGFVASRFPIVAEMPALPDISTTEERYSSRLTRVRIRTEAGHEFVLASIHLPTIRRGLERLMRRNINGLELHIQWWAQELDRMVKGLSEAGNTPFIVAGDFNMPSDDSSMATLKTAMRFGFEESGIGYGYTRPTKYPWFRIDHILSSPEWVFTSCWVGEDCGSDHLPVLAELVLPGASARDSGTPR
ncbi:endonuclease/exonuclease/phosphatase family protein [Singulisphaera sp. PoT]|uniref:endonuclease/exonuclease/phosphatase family protein n=1 Tax=Singulisphaera sp. PoT TaxID=3411797 RepID=UPI003BF5CA11